MRFITKVFLSIFGLFLILGTSVLADDLKENSWRYQNGEHIEVQTKNADENFGISLMSSPTMRGIDVSKHQGVINWDLVYGNIDYAIIRCGFGNDETSQDDTQWYNNANACTRLGIPFGVYIYSYATNTAMAESEANHVLRLISGYNISFPIYLDMEDNVQANLSASERGAIASTFCNKIQNAGYEVGIYANKNWWENYLTDSAFNNGSWYRWVAQYNSSCTYSGSYTMWQYTSSGSVNGISGNVDMNYWYGDWRGVNSSVTVTTTVADNITSSNAIVRGTVSYNGSRPSEAGIYFGASQNNMSKVATDIINHNKNPFDMWYDLNSEAGQYLNGGTTYYWQCYTVVNGKEYKGDIKSFTTITDIIPDDKYTDIMLDTYLTGYVTTSGMNIKNGMTVEITNPLKKKINGKVIIVYRGSDNSIVELKVKDMSVNANETIYVNDSLTRNIVTASSNLIYTADVYIWNSASGMTPLSKKLNCEFAYE